MIVDDKQLGKPQILYKDTKANVEAMTGLEEGSFAYATDTDEIGSYDGATWNWGSVGDIGTGADHVHGLARWAADGSSATFDLPDFAEYIEAVYDDGSLIDPATVTLSGDLSQITLDATPVAASVIVAQYVIARI